MTESIDVKLNNGTMWLCVSCGEVVSQQKWSETRVSSHGGSISADGRHVSAPTISSVVTEKHNFGYEKPMVMKLQLNFQVAAFRQERAIKFGSHGVAEKDSRQDHIYLRIIL